jgi:thiamine-phosphate pyrophosphorylase
MVAATLRAVNGRLYLVCDARPREFLRRALEGGVDVIQLRDRSLDDDRLVRAAEAFRAAANEFGVPFILNDRPDLVEATGADGVHLGQDDGAFPDTGLRGRSTHAPEQALAEQVADYLSIGPVWATPTKPGRPAAGIDYVRWAAEHVDRPWFAIGGIDATNVREVVEAGARRIVVVRAITEADDPEAAARELRSGLPE